MIAILGVLVISDFPGGSCCERQAVFSLKGDDGGQIRVVGVFPKWIRGDVVQSFQPDFENNSGRDLARL